MPKKWTLSYWAKTAKKQPTFVHAGASGNGINDAVTFGFQNGLPTFKVSTASGAGACTQTVNQSFPQSEYHYWHHYTWTVNTASPNPSQRLRLFIDGIERTAWAAGNGPCLTQNQAIPFWNQTGATQVIGADPHGLNNFDGYLSLVQFFDGAVVDPKDLGMTQGKLWVPVVYDQKLW